MPGRIRIRKRSQASELDVAVKQAYEAGRRDGEIEGTHRSYEDTRDEVQGMRDALRAAVSEGASAVSEVHRLRATYMLQEATGLDLAKIEQRVIAHAQRQAEKEETFGSLYGMGPERFREATSSLTAEYFEQLRVEGAAFRSQFTGTATGRSYSGQEPAAVGLAQRPTRGRDPWWEATEGHLWFCTRNDSYYIKDLVGWRMLQYGGPDENLAVNRVPRNGSAHNDGTSIHHWLRYRSHEDGREDEYAWYYVCGSNQGEEEENTSADVGSDDAHGDAAALIDHERSRAFVDESFTVTPVSTEDEEEDDANDDSYALSI